MNLTDEEYMVKAKKLNKEQRERVLSRMAGKLPKRLKKEKLTEEQAIAIQLEHEDAQLREWKEKIAVIRDKELKAELKAKEKLEKAAAKAAIDRVAEQIKANTKKVADKSEPKKKG